MSKLTDLLKERLSELKHEAELIQAVIDLENERELEVLDAITELNKPNIQVVHEPVESHNAKEIIPEEPKNTSGPIKISNSEPAKHKPHVADMKVCAYCRNPFPPRSNRQQYCSTECKNAALEEQKKTETDEIFDPGVNPMTGKKVK